ncbi:MAG: acyl-CoA dehydrogenase family protein [Gemmatimonadaceae bacterium]
MTRTTPTSAAADHLVWPFFDEPHRKLAHDLSLWAAREIDALAESRDVDTVCRTLVQMLGEADWLRYCVPASHGGAFARLDVRALCLCRETLAQFSGLADFAFAMQGLGAGPISLFGSDALKDKYLPGVRDGTRIAAFALTEPEAGSDVTAMSTLAHRDGAGWRLDGEKTFISNAGIAHQYVVFAKLADTREPAFGAFVVDADNPGLAVTERIPTLAPHPLGTVVFNDCRVSADAVVGPPEKGLRIALATLDVFRSTVAAAALGFARRALAEAIPFVRERRTFGKRLSEHQITRAKIAEMALAIDTSALLVYRAAWTRDTQQERVTREAAMAKLHATESAQRVIDDAVQLMGGRGLVAGVMVERLYREIRALRIYEGTSEIQRLLIAGVVLGD